MKYDVPDDRKEALSWLQAKLAAIKDRAFNAMRDKLRATDDHIMHSGYGDVNSAVVGTLKYYLDEHDKCIAAYIKKFPDK